MRAYSLSRAAVWAIHHDCRNSIRLVPIRTLSVIGRPGSVASNCPGADRIGGPAVRSTPVHATQPGTEAFTEALLVLIERIAEVRRLGSAAELLHSDDPLAAQYRLALWEPVEHAYLDVAAAVLAAV
jgi:hypothetical protein